jgi:hypothetical protein
MKNSLQSSYQSRSRVFRPLIVSVDPKTNRVSRTHFDECERNENMTEQSASVLFDQNHLLSSLILHL